MSTPPEHHLLDDPVQVVEESGRRRLLLLRGTNTERVVFFSDAVFAIALTLLVLDIRLPDGLADAEVNTALLELGPKLMAFCVSFVVVVGAWLTHFRRFRLLRGYDEWIIRWNFALLFLVCLIRFPTSVFSTHANGLTTVLYGGTLGAIFLVQVASWVHARKAGLLLSVVDRTVYLTTRNQLLAVGLVFLLPLPFVLRWPLVAWLGWGVLGAIAPRIGRWAALRSLRHPEPGGPAAVPPDAN